MNCSQSKEGEKANVRCTVICLTYNHAKYIRRALDGFVQQQTTCKFEVIVHDDASTDGTAEIIREYAEHYGEVIIPVLQSDNQWRKGKTLSKTFVYPRIRGEYVAFCEGDDFWCDPLKLQRQIDFLDTHPDYSVCFHPVRIVYESRSRADEIFPSQQYRFNKTTLTIADLLKHNFIQTNSVMFRWRFHKDSYDLIPDRILPGDHALNLLHAEIGKIGFLPQVMAVYLKHSGSLWTGARRTPDWFLRKAEYAIRFAEFVNARFQYCDQKEMAFLKCGLKLARRCNGNKGTFRFKSYLVICLVPGAWGMLFGRKSKHSEAKGRIKALILALSW